MNKKKWVWLVLAVVIGLALGGGVYFLKNRIFEDSGKNDITEKENNTTNKENDTDVEVPASAYRMSGNSIENFDLAFLKLENELNNKIYSPLSIKYALAMLEEGANGISKKQITNVIGDYQAKKYVNNEHMSFANAMFIKDSYKNNIKSSYLSNLEKRFNASVLYDSFQTPNTINKWISDKTFNLINDTLESVNNVNYFLINALAIDMEWVNKIQNDEYYYGIGFPHENYGAFVDVLQDYHPLEFKGVNEPVQSVEISATANKYDIVNVLGEENIRNTIEPLYRKWLVEEREQTVVTDEEVNEYLDEYIKEIGTGYNQIDSSTDFNFYIDDDIKVFAKDLKTYDGMTLQYVGIMPTEESLDSYIKSIDAKSINTIINNLKPIELDSFKEGVITEINAYIPLFKIDYDLKLMQDLKTLGITDVFDEAKADLSNITSDESVIIEAGHKANIEFSNYGIKAAAVTFFGGDGDDTDAFEYLYDVPVERIDLTFNKPYFFLIRDKDTNEIWFTGTVYEPNIYTPVREEDMIYPNWD